jgi:hypothetical protein
MRIVGIEPVIEKLILFLRSFRDVAQPGSVPAWGAGGRWFESSHPDEKS